MSTAQTVPTRASVGAHGGTRPDSQGMWNWLPQLKLIATAHLYPQTVSLWSTVLAKYLHWLSTLKCQVTPHFQVGSSSLAWFLWVLIVQSFMWVFHVSVSCPVQHHFHHSLVFLFVRIYTIIYSACPACLRHLNLQLLLYTRKKLLFKSEIKCRWFKPTQQQTLPGDLNAVNGAMEGNGHGELQATSSRRPGDKTAHRFLHACKVLM